MMGHLNSRWLLLMVFAIMVCSLAGCGGSRSGSDGSVFTGSSEPPPGPGDPRK